MIKLPLIGLFFLITLLTGARSCHLRVSTILMSIFFSFVGIIWVVYGLSLNNPGALSMLTVMVLYPLLFCFFCGFYYHEASLSLLRLFIFAGWTLFVIDIMVVIDYVYLNFGFYQVMVNIFGDNSVVVDNATRYFKFTIPNITSLIFILPFLISSLIFGKVYKSRFALLLLLILVAIMSGRRALLVTMIIAPIISVIITSGVWERRVAWKILSVFTLFISVIVVFYSIHPDYFVEMVSNIFNFSDNKSNLERKYQFDALIDGFMLHPIFGNGAGAVASYIRSDMQPWAYELSYIAFLFQFGILGILSYFIGFVFIITFLIKQVKVKGRDSFEFFYLAGFLSFIMANASNPYLMKFDYMWVIFIPLALYNSCKVKL